MEKENKTHLTIRIDKNINQLISQADGATKTDKVISLLVAGSKYQKIKKSYDKMSEKHIREKIKKNIEEESGDKISSSYQTILYDVYANNWADKMKCDIKAVPKPEKIDFITLHRVYNACDKDIEKAKIVIMAFFAWRRPEPMQHGYRLNGGYGSLAFLLPELIADITNPERVKAVAEAKLDKTQLEKEAKYAAIIERSKKQGANNSREIGCNVRNLS
ncbi:hypothetical protein [uncultured Flavobacterium sp.]|jgi:hypothetical protein|uniref:hypothetical protein n=1 Tax=uncultured Flavobacterium sp. TaxID=165435 RepID=UPI00259A0C3F|nr:hypothetical protein [uncultured Flavobacterium sp.]